MLPSDFSPERAARQRFLQRQADLREASDVSLKRQLRDARDTLNMHRQPGGPNQKDAAAILMTHGTPADKKLAKKAMRRPVPGKGKLKTFPPPTSLVGKRGQNEAASNLFAAVAIKGGKPVEQLLNLEKKEIDIAVKMLKKRHPGAKISIENSSGMVVKVEACEGTGVIIEGASKVRGVGKDGLWDVNFQVEREDLRPGGYVREIMDHFHGLGWEATQSLQQVAVRVPARSMAEAIKKVSALL